MIPTFYLVYCKGCLNLSIQRLMGTENIGFNMAALRGLIVNKSINCQKKKKFKTRNINYNLLNQLYISVSVTPTPSFSLFFVFL